jgi:hypothetical protein
VSKSYLPEYQQYRDTGCSLHSACLTCPFETCRYEDVLRHAKGGSSGKGQLNQRLINELSSSGMNYAEIARRLNLSSRTVRRLVSV